MSWLLSEGGHEVLCNRDELRSRGRALPPQEWELDGVRCLAPVDSDAGGTWITTNEHGVTLCLLNLYPQRSVPLASKLESRGQLVRRLASAGSEAAVRARLASYATLRFQPFTLLVLESARVPRVARFDGHRLSFDGEVPTPPLTSSSLDSAAAEATRRELWQRDVAISLAEPLAFHGSHLPVRGPFSPCMHREDARTVSMTHVRVTPDRVSMAYADGPPCRNALGVELRLVRPGALATA